MDSTIIGALIGAVGTIVAAIITVRVAARKQSPPSHVDSPIGESRLLSERQSQTDRGASAPMTTTRESSPKKTATESELGRGASVPASGEKEGLTFDEVIEAIRRHQPGAILGRTAEQGPYFDRAKRLTNYQLHQADPPWYGAVQANGKIMWLYLGKGGKICCGDKE
jgi:hypothetical protein